MYEEDLKFFTNPFDQEISDYTIDFVGFLISGLVFARLLMRKKFLFYLAFGIAALGIIGCIASKITSGGDKSIINRICLYLGKFGIAAAYQGCFVII